MKKNSNSTIRLLVAGGGTGGHIYPALAIAAEVMARGPANEIHFVGTARGLETKIIPPTGYRLHLLPGGALNNVGLRQRIATLVALPLAILKGIALLWRVRPTHILGVGGYASGPLLLAAILTFRRVYVFECNAIPGLTNRWLAPFVKLAFLNFQETMRFFYHSEVVGIPTRAGLAPTARQAHQKLRILIFGGSQGARGINLAVIEAIEKSMGANESPPARMESKNADWLSQVEIVHQIGARDFVVMKKRYEALGGKATTNPQCLEYLHDMPERYAWADLIFCRAGASTIAELAVCHKAAVLIPFPDAADNHQWENAKVLADAGAAHLVSQKEFTSDKFAELVGEYLADRSPLALMEQKIANFAKPDCAKHLVDILLAD